MAPSPLCSTGWTNEPHRHNLVQTRHTHHICVACLRTHLARWLPHATTLPFTTFSPAAPTITLYPHVTATPHRCAPTPYLPRRHFTSVTTRTRTRALPAGCGWHYLSDTRPAFAPCRYSPPRLHVCCLFGFCNTATCPHILTPAWHHRLRCHSARHNPSVTCHATTPPYSLPTAAPWFRRCGLHDTASAFLPTFMPPTSCHTTAPPLAGSRWDLCAGTLLLLRCISPAILLLCLLRAAHKHEQHLATLAFLLLLPSARLLYALRSCAAPLCHTINNLARAPPLLPANTYARAAWAWRRNASTRAWRMPLRSQHGYERR